MLAETSTLSFEQIRRHCFFVIKGFSKSDIKHRGRADCGILRSELEDIIEFFESANLVCHSHDLTDAFYSSVFELEFGKRFLPNALIAPNAIVFSQKSPCVARLKRFTHDYPRVAVSFYKANGTFELSQNSVIRDLREFFLVLQNDPLVRNYHL